MGVLRLTSLVQHFKIYRKWHSAALTYDSRVSKPQVSLCCTPLSLVGSKGGQGPAAGSQGEGMRGWGWEQQHTWVVSGCIQGSPREAAPSRLCQLDGSVSFLSRGAGAQGFSVQLASEAWMTCSRLALRIREQDEIRGWKMKEDKEHRRLAGIEESAQTLCHFLTKSDQLELPGNEKNRRQQVSKYRQRCSCLEPQGSVGALNPCSPAVHKLQAFPGSKNRPKNVRHLHPPHIPHAA